jgi:hypothetical protein
LKNELKILAAKKHRKRKRKSQTLYLSASILRLLRLFAADVSAFPLAAPGSGVHFDFNARDHSNRF